MKAVIVLLTLICSYAQASDVGLRAFERTLYPALRTNCVQCHGDFGIAIGHSVSDVAEAYRESKGLADFNNIPDSNFVRRVRSKHWLQHDPNARGMDEADIITLIRAWWDEGEFSSSATYDLISAPITLPRDLPTLPTGRYANVSWDLGDVNPQLAGCVVRVNVQRASSPGETHLGSFRVKDISTKCTSARFTGKGIFFFVNDQVASYENIYSGLEIKATNQDSTLKTEPMILIERATTSTLKFVIKSLSIQ